MSISTDTLVKAENRQCSSAPMVFIPGGTFRMGSDKHYPEEAPVHRVRVDGFWIDPTPVTNRQFRQFVEATGHITFAEIAPDPKDYPGALPHMLRAALMQSSSVGSTIGIRLRRTPDGPAVKQFTYVFCQLMPAATEDGMKSAKPIPNTLPPDTSVMPSRTIVLTRGDSESARPWTQNRPVTLGSSVVPLMSLPPCSMIKTSITSNGSGGTRSRASSVRVP